MRDGCLQRVRYTGKPIHQPLTFHAKKNGVLLGFTCPLDRKTAEDPDSWSVLQWNYRWSANYGSPHLSVRHPPKQGYDTLDGEVRRRCCRTGKRCSWRSRTCAPR